MVKDKASLKEKGFLKSYKSCEKSSQSYTATPKVDMSMIQLIGDYNYDSRLEVGQRHETRCGLGVKKYKIDGKMKRSV